MNDIIIIKTIKMCKIGHSSALCGRELAHFLTRPVTIATPVNNSTPDGRSAPRPTAIRRRTERFGLDIFYTIILYHYTVADSECLKGRGEKIKRAHSGQHGAPPADTVAFLT